MEDKAFEALLLTPKEIRPFLRDTSVKINDMLKAQVVKLERLGVLIPDQQRCVKCSKYLVVTQHLDCITTLEGDMCISCYGMKEVGK